MSDVYRGKEVVVSLCNEVKLEIELITKSWTINLRLVADLLLSQCRIYYSKSNGNMNGKNM